MRRGRHEGAEIAPCSTAMQTTLTEPGLTEPRDMGRVMELRAMRDRWPTKLGRDAIQNEIDAVLAEARRASKVKQNDRDSK